MHIGMIIARRPLLYYIDGTVPEPIVRQINFVLGSALVIYSSLNISNHDERAILK